MLNVAIIGVGNIALLFDTDKNDFTRTSSHIKAIYLHKKFTLKYVSDIVDTNLAQVQDFFPNVEYSKNYHDLIVKNDIDILVICTPTSTHFDILNNFKSNKNIKTFFMEKPLFEKIDNYRNINENIKDRIVINYLRRFDKEMQNLKLQIQNNSFLDLQKIIIKYCKGLKNNGSHMIDLINFLFNNPEIISSQILAQTEGFYQNDITYDIHIEIKYQNQSIPIYFIGLNHHQYNTIEMELFFETQVIKYINSKAQIHFYKIVNDEIYPTYKVISDIPNIKHISNSLILDAYEHISQIVEKNIINISSFEDEEYNVNFLNKILKD